MNQGMHCNFKEIKELDLAEWEREQSSGLFQGFDYNGVKFLLKVMKD
jgi:hypothetical protein